MTDPTYITVAEVKEKFLLWEQYCQVTDSPLTPQEILNNMIVQAEIEFLDYVNFEEDEEATDQQKRHLLNIIRYYCFSLQHGDTEFDHDPQIVRDYKSTIEKLSQGAGDDDGITMTAKDRLFGAGQWFTSND